jgi:superoxide dismutase, Cu-Zn family
MGRRGVFRSGAGEARRRRRRITAVLALAAVVLPAGPAGATHEAPSARGIEQACPAGLDEAGFLDVEGNTHEAAIHCLAWWGLTTGRTPTAYAPEMLTRRDQMASFLVRLLRAAGVDVPSARQAFADVGSDNAHAESVNGLVALGVVRGYPDGTFRPSEPVRRDHMASFISRTGVHTRGEAIRDTHQWFADVPPGDVHAAAVNGLAAAGIVEGRDAEARRYDPHVHVARDAMASFLARTVELLIDEGHVAPPVEGAVATMVDAGGAVLGRVLFTPDEGAVQVRASLEGLPPGGFHGFHVHTAGACAPDFAAAGGHLDPGGDPHGAHAGDLPVLLVRGDGRADVSAVTDRFAVGGLVEGDGTAVIVHALPDNYANIPERYAPDGPDATTLATGDAGARLACGVVEPAWVRPEVVAGPVHASATVVDADGTELGTTTFTDRGGVVEVRASLAGLPPGGFHGFHVHTVGACAPDFAAAGGHFDPGGDPHGAHAGDLPVLLVRGDGRADVSVVTDRMAVGGLVEGDGTAVIVHALPDNYANIPERYAPAGPDAATLATGDSGARLACGVVEGS